MKTTKKLIPAIVMLLVSAVLLSTASYAWFSMNTKVTVSAMTVHATASKNLLISDTSDGTYLPSLALTTNVNTLVPASTSGSGNTPVFYKLKDVGHGMLATSFARAFDTTFEVANEDDDYVKETMFIKSTGQGATNLKASITYTGGAQSLDPALRVLIIAGSNRYYYTPVSIPANPTAVPPTLAITPSSWAGITAISTAEVPTACAANMGADASVKAIAGITYYDDAECNTTTNPVPAVGSDVTGKHFKLPAGIATIAGTNEAVSTNTTPILTSIDQDTAVQIDVYIWYEGQDTNCKSTNAVTLDNTVFTIEFTVEG